VVDVPTTTKIEEALHDVRSMLDADGYQLELCDTNDYRIVLSVMAGPEACAECLVPQELLSAVVEKHLQSVGLALSVEIRYPREHDKQYESHG
jgi:Fe-S cluster biogenesis protein NfuA